MKKIGILNKDISGIIAGLGHMDAIVIADAGLPIPDGPKRIDLAVKESVPSFMDVLDAILTEMKVQKVVIASEMESVSPSLFEKIAGRFADVEFVMIPHTEFKAMTKSSKAVIRTGEFTPYANIILEAGVVF